MAARIASSWLNVWFLMWTERRVIMEARLESSPAHYESESDISFQHYTTNMILIWNLFTRLKG